MVGIGYWLCEISNGGVVQIVGQGDAVAFHYLKDFMFTVSVECGPLDGLLAGVAPGKVLCFTTMLNA